MKSHHRAPLLLIGFLALAMFTGCGDSNTQTAQPEQTWDPAWGPNPDSPNGGASEWSDGMAEEEVIRDTAYVVVERRQAGGKLVPSGETSPFDGRPRMKRTPLESMIIVEGDQTRQRSAYLLPANDYNVVQVGHRLQASTLARWESVGEDRIPPPPRPGEDETYRSRTGGAAEQFAY
jgi:hypothetical protein